MVKIRLTRLGRHKLPFFRIVVIDSRARRDGAYIEKVGTYEPFEGVVNINEEIALSWLKKGAQPSDTVKNLLREQGVWKKFMDSKVQSKKEHNANKVKKEVKKPEAKKAAASKPASKPNASKSTSQKKTVSKK